MADDQTLSRKIPKLRETFAELFAGSLNSGAYDERDIERVRLDDEHVRPFLRQQKGNIEKAANSMDLVLKWRKELEINDLDDKSFPRELHEMGAVYWHNADNKGQKILYFSVKKNKKDPEKLLMVKKFVAWQIEKHFRKNPNDKIVALLDMTDAGFANMDMDLIKYQISCFTTYFPGLLAYMLIYEMPWVLNAIWKVVKTILSTEQQKAVIFVKRNEIHKYIEQDQLWKHMGGMDDYEYTYIPSEDSGIELANGDMETPTEEDDLFTMSLENCANYGAAAAAKKRVTFSESESVVYTSFDNDSVSLVSDEGEGKGLSNNNNNKSTSSNGAQRRAVDEDNTFMSSVLTITPAEDLEFCPSDDNRDSLDIISLTNTTEKNVAYKVKTTSPEKYRVRPSTGVIQPGSHADIHVYLHTGQGTNVAKDKFLIMFMEVEPEVTVSQVNDLFKVTSRDAYCEHRLRCRLVAMKPASPQELQPINYGNSTMSEQLNKLSQQSKTDKASFHQRPLRQNWQPLGIPTINILSASSRSTDSSELELNNMYLRPLDSSDSLESSDPSEPLQKNSFAKIANSRCLQPAESAVDVFPDLDPSLVGVWEEEYNEMDTLLSSHQQLESQMKQLRKFILVLIGVLFLFLLTVFLTYWTEYLPVNKYTVNACVPHYL